MLEAIILNILRKFISGSNGLPRNIIFKQYFSENSFQTRKLNSWSLTKCSFVG